MFVALAAAEGGQLDRSIGENRRSASSGDALPRSPALLVFEPEALSYRQSSLPGILEQYAALANAGQLDINPGLVFGDVP